MLDIDGAEGGYMCGDRVYGNSVQSTQFYHESKTALKQVYYLKEKKKSQWTRKVPLPEWLSAYLIDLTIVII